MKKMLFSFLTVLLITFSTTYAQRFDWARFTPLTTGNGNGGSGVLSVATDGEGNIYTVSVFNDPIIVGTDTLLKVGNQGRPDILITKWNAAGDVLNYRHIANYAVNGNPDPQKLIYDTVSNHLIFSISSYYNGTQVTLQGNSTASDTALSLHCGALLRFNKNLDFITQQNIGTAGTYSTPITHKDGYVYAAHGYYTTVSKIDSAGNTLWSLAPSNSFYIHSITISSQDTIYVIGYSQYGGTISYGGVSAATPTAGNFTHTMIFKIDTAGNVHQALYFAESTHYTNPVRLTTDNASNVYVASGYAIAGQVIGNDTLGPLTGGTDGFITKLTSQLQPVWVKEFHHTGGNMELRDIQVNSSNEVMVIGSCGGNATFGTYAMPFSQYGSAFLVKMNSTSGAVTYGAFYGPFSAGSGRPYSFANRSNKYYIGGLSYANNLPPYTPGGASYGCYQETRATAFLTCFTDTAALIPNVSLQFNGSTLTAAVNSPDATIKWFAEGVELTGETGNSIVPDSNTHYMVVTDYYGCTASDTLTVGSITIVGISAGLQAEENLTLYPNPVNQHLTVKGIIGNYRIADLSGRVLIETNLSTADVSKLASGIYFVQSGNSRLKFVKQ